MTLREKILTAALLQMGANEFHEHGCNDMDADLLNNLGFTDAEKSNLVKEFCALRGWNRNGMELMAKKLRMEVL